jgi:hypothetical protein
VCGAQHPFKPLSQVSQVSQVSLISLLFGKMAERETGSGSTNIDKRAKKKARTDALYFGYTNETNPFGDNQLREQFVWHKNEETTGVEVSKKERRKHQEQVVAQIEKVKERRKEREAERVEFERLKLEQERLEQQDEAAEFFEKEKRFHEQQVYKRTLVRVSDERTHNVDVLTRNIVVLAALREEEGEITGVHSQKSEFLKHFGLRDIERRTVDDVLKSIFEEDGVGHQELEELIEGLTTFVKAERNPTNKQYWQAATTMAKSKLSVLKDGLELTRGIHACVCQDVMKHLDGKNSVELEAMRAEMLSSTQGVDMEFDEAVYRMITLRQARMRVTEIHQSVQKQLEDLVAKMPNAPASSLSSSSEAGKIGPSEAEKKLYAELASKPMEEGEETLGQHTEVVVAADETSSSSSSSRDAGDGERPKRPPGWGYKYRSRKPQYLNKVKSGYDWNKYNRAHYDRDNPPPKTVQGYKFNIFYPDLIDNMVTPKYTLEAADTQDFCIIRFSAGPPYEDIAFKIVNKEWEIGKRAGFKSTFQRGILQLHFNFKLLRYRR